MHVAFPLANIGKFVSSTEKDVKLNLPHDYLDMRPLVATQWGISPECIVHTAVLMTIYGCVIIENAVSMRSICNKTVSAYVCLISRLNTPACIVEAALAAASEPSESARINTPVQPIKRVIAYSSSSQTVAASGTCLGAIWTAVHQ